MGSLQPVCTANRRSSWIILERLAIHVDRVWSRRGRQPRQPLRAGNLASLAVNSQRAQQSAEPALLRAGIGQSPFSGGYVKPQHPNSAGLRVAQSGGSKRLQLDRRTIITYEVRSLNSKRIQQLAFQPLKRSSRRSPLIRAYFGRRLSI